MASSIEKVMLKVCQRKQVTFQKSNHLPKEANIIKYNLCMGPVPFVAANSGPMHTLPPPEKLQEEAQDTI